MLVSVRAMLDFFEDTEYEVKCEGSLEVNVEGYCSLNVPKSGCITWVKNTDEHSLECFHGCKNVVIVARKTFPHQIENASFLITQEPKAVFFTILEHFWSERQSRGIATSAVVESGDIADDVVIGHHCYIGKDVRIGAGTVIEHNVSIYHRVEIGRKCVIHSGTVIGTDGYGYFMDYDGIPNKVIHYGGVKIGDEVEIGANSAIARGTIDDTVIGSHTKIDNLCHIAHNCVLGKGVMLTAGSVLGGSAVLKDGVYLAPGSVIKNQLTLEKNAFVGMGGVVVKDVKADTVVAGVPAKPLRKVKDHDK